MKTGILHLSSLYFLSRNFKTTTYECLTILFFKTFKQPQIVNKTSKEAHTHMTTYSESKKHIHHPGCNTENSERTPSHLYAQTARTWGQVTRTFHVSRNVVGGQRIRGYRKSFLVFALFKSTTRRYQATLIY